MPHQNGEGESCFMDNRTNILGFDLSDPQYDALFERHQQSHAAFDESERLKERANRAFDALGAKLTYDIRHASDELVSTMMKLTMLVIRGLQEQEDELDTAEYKRTIIEVLHHAPPPVQHAILRQFFRLAQERIDGILESVAALQLVLSREEAEALTRPLLVAAIALTDALGIAACSYERSTLEWQLNGMPFWDAQNMRYDPSRPSFQTPHFSFDDDETASGGTASNPAAPTQEASDALIQRLFTGLDLGGLTDL